MATISYGTPRAAKHNPTHRAHKFERVMEAMLIVIALLLIALLIRRLVTDVNPLPAVMAIAGLVLLCFFYAYVFVLPDDLTSTATDRTLGIASQLFGYTRAGFTKESMENVCRIVLPETLASAICITDGNSVIASAGERSSDFAAGSAIQLATTKRAMRSGETSVFVTESGQGHGGLPLPLHAGIVAPLIVGETSLGTMELYYRRQGEIDQRQLALASGFADLLSAQLATFELERQAEISARVELKALQSQVDPHFLFNTLGTIVSIVRTDPEKARSLIINFSDYYRQTLSDSDKLVTVTQEVDQAMRYATLMQARYGEERLAVTTRIDPTVAELPVPSFVVQPLIENSIKHGMREMGTLHLSLDARPQPGGIALCVEDDGVGMDAQTLSTLFDPDRPKAQQGSGGAGLALSNVLARIRIFFGPESRLDIESTQGVGTKATIVLLGEPRQLQQGEGTHVERTHSR